MKRIILIAVIAVLSGSCASNKMLLPTAVNTIGTATFEDLRLQRSDYKVLKNVTAEASISYESNRSGDNVTIKGIDEDFVLHYEYDKKKGWQHSYSGVAKLGYLSNDYYSADGVQSPEDIVRRLAIYRAINAAKQMGGDGFIEPVISTNVEQVSNRTVIFKSTVSGKVIKIKTDDEL